MAGDHQLAQACCASAGAAAPISDAPTSIVKANASDDSRDIGCLFIIMLSVPARPRRRAGAVHL